MVNFALCLHHGGLVEESELVGVGEPGHERARVARPEERLAGDVVRGGHTPLPERGDTDVTTLARGLPSGSTRT
jgi:hypothetical protein